ncbi:MerR family transcriptional regulator [Acutalibacter muris]|uniref:MerR family transcriptional regulator n=1 Tax=Acutalibacter muris TaxID=1796620 RepID=UPI001C3E88BD|nr:MerR family transcriptional regulator [Acutalibacter muris]
MTDLVKIREVTERYNIPARTLRYYEDMGLIESARVADYAYRLYDQRALKRLEQILILRKLNISIKDIQLIFQAAGSDTVLDVLGRKVEDINHEVALLRDLRDIILEFIEQIRKMDFSSDSDVKLLYERAATVETRIEKIPYEGNASKVNRLFDISEKLKKAPEVRLVQISPFKAFTSGADTIENVMGPFQEWQEAHNHLVKKMIYGAPDFLWFEEDKATWIWAVEDGVTAEEVAPYELIEFEGGLYAAAMSVDGDDDIGNRVHAGLLKWIEDSGFELDERPGHRTMGHMLNPTEEIKRALGYDQMDLYVPVKVREKGNGTAD